MVLAHCVVRVSSCERIIFGDDVRDNKINLAMRAMYEMGYRRFRTIKCPKTGDAEKFAILAVEGN